jgi:phosphoribosylamine---glycine ligase
MRFLGIGESNDLAAMYHGLAARGHEVRVFVEQEASRDVYAGMLDFTDDWQAELGWLREAGEGGMALFESASRGQTQDALRRDGFQVIGGSALGDRLEAEREFGQDVLRGFGLHTAATHGFTSYAAAIDFLRQRGGRYVLKFNGADSPRTRNYIGEMSDAADMLALLAMYQSHDSASNPPDFVLMQHVQGVEVGVGAYFNGEAFLAPACIDFEHKRFFAGDLGELTGEMGTIVSYRGAEKLFNASLARVAPLLQDSGYCGYINLNMIVNDAGLWPLEFTSRFGYPGFAICEALHDEGWDTIFRRMLRRNGLTIATKRGFAAGVVLTVPPFPYSHGYAELSKGEPICFHPGMREADRAALHFAEVARLGEHLVTSGCSGYVGVATGTGATVQAASEAAYRVTRKVVVPNVRYRTDIGERVWRHDLARLGALGWL